MERNKHINRVAVAGIIGNVILLVSKLTVGFSAKSQTMIADGLNSAGDVFSSLMTLIGNRLSAQPGDEDHPYGHGKAEYVFSLIISLSLLLVAFSIFQRGINALSSKSSFVYSHWLVVVALLTILLKVLLYLYAQKIGKRFNSLLAIANAQDHRNDIFITGLTLISIVTGLYNLYIIDAIGAMLISLWIGFTGFEIFTSAYQVLMDQNIDPSIHNEMAIHVNSLEGVDHLDSITATPVGLNFLLIVKVSIDAHISVYDGHSIATNIKEELLTFPNIEDVIVHVNPAQYHP